MLQPPIDGQSQKPKRHNGHDAHDSESGAVTHAVGQAIVTFLQEEDKRSRKDR